MPEQRLSRRSSYRHAESRETVIYQTLDDLKYEPPGDISAKSGEKKTITKPVSTCRVTKVCIACTHVDDPDDDDGKSSAESKGEREDHNVRIDPSLYEKVPYQVVAPVTWGIATQLAQTVIKKTGWLAKWLKEDVLKVETVTVTVEGYFCEGEHPKVTVKEVGRKTKSDTAADVGKDQKEVEVFEGTPPAKDKKKGGKKDDKKSGTKDTKTDAKKSGSSTKDSSKDKKDESSSAPVKTTKEHWFYVGSLMPKFRSWFWLPNYVYPRWVSPNVYEIHIETCAETRIIYVEAFYAAHWKVEFGRASAAETKDHDDLDWNLLTPFDESVKKTSDEIKLWCDTFDSSTSGSFFNVIFKIVKVFKNLFDNYKLTLSQEGPGPRINPEISAESFEKFVKIIEAFTKLRENLDKRQSDGHTNWEFLSGQELKFKFLEGSIESNWRHREHAGRRVGWQHETAANITLLQIEYGLTVGVSPSWTGHLELKGSGKLTISVVAKGKFSTDSKDLVVAFWKSSSGKVVAWWQEKVQKKKVEDKTHDDVRLEDELSADIREGIPVTCECKPEVSLEIPVFLEELFNLSPKAEGGLEAGGFIGFDDAGPCLRLGIDIKDIEVSLEISALGGWISFTLGPVPIIPTENWSKKLAGWLEQKVGTRSLGVEEGQFRFPPLPKKDAPKADATKAISQAKAKAGV